MSRRSHGRTVALAIGAAAALALLGVYAFQSGYQVGSDMAVRDARQAEARR